ncbi:MAG: sugar ABC transporter permease [Spirochaetia bacterium]|jgi:raffinose/stachyose/melibiose transport system permease protein
MREGNRLYSYIWVAPCLLLYVIFFAIPLFIGFYSAMTNWTMGREVTAFVGLENFRHIFSDPELLNAVRNTFLYTVVVVIFKNLFGFVLAIILSTPLSRKRRVNNLFRTLFYIPAVMSTIVLGVVFTRILHPLGLLNACLKSIGLGFLAQNWLINTRVVMLSIAGVSVWQWTGYHMVIYLAGIQGIAPDYLEAATIDGASTLQRLRKVTIPLLAATINMNVILSLIGGLRGFSEVYVLTNGGPGHASQVLTTEVLSKFAEGRWGLGTALNAVLFLLVAVICIPLLRQMRRQEVEE